MINLETLSRQELNQLLEQVQQQIVKRERGELDTARDQIMAIAHRFNMSLEQFLEKVGLIGPDGVIKERRKHATSGTKVAPKYRNPDDHRQVWTGRGRKPEWMKDTKGRPLEAFEIANQPA